MSTRTTLLCDRCGAVAHLGSSSFSSVTRLNTASWRQAILVEGIERPIEGSRFEEHLDLCPECVDSFKEWTMAPVEKVVQG